MRKFDKVIADLTCFLGLVLLKFLGCTYKDDESNTCARRRDNF